MQNIFSVGKIRVQVFHQLPTLTVISIRILEQKEREKRMDIRVSKIEKLKFF